MKKLKNKTKWNLINLKDIEGIVKVREYGNSVYKGEKENWKENTAENYVDAIKRHLVEMDENGIFSLDKESELPHIWHIQANSYFLSWFERGYRVKNEYSGC